MDYKNFAVRFGLAILGVAGFTLSYVFLQKYVSPHIPFIADYPSSIIIPYITIIFAIVAYYSRRNILFTLQIAAAAFFISSTHTAFNMYFPQYREIFTLTFQTIFIVWMLKRYFDSRKAS